MANKLLWQIIIVAGLFPFAIAFLSGTGVATLEYTADFNFSLFSRQFFAYSAEHWLTYIMGILLILISMKHLRYE